MDGKLAFRTRRHFPLPAVLSRPSCRAHWPPRMVRKNALDKAFRPFVTGIPPPTPRRPRSRAGSDVAQNHARFYHDHHAHGDCHRYAMRKVPPLPILRIPCMGHSLPSVESRIPPYCAICIVGRARMGVERVSEYAAELGNVCGCASYYSRRRVVGYEE